MEYKQQNIVTYFLEWHSKSRDSILLLLLLFLSSSNFNFLNDFSVGDDKCCCCRLGDDRLSNVIAGGVVGDGVFRSRIK